MRASRDARATGDALLAYGRELEARGDAQLGGSFTDIPEADRLIKERPEAFLFGVLFTQGIPAERAWAGPYLLSQRLGHLDLARLAEEPAAVGKAVSRPPALHRFVATLPAWIVSAARRLLDDYDGDAARIWAPGTHVLEVTERLRAFDGIGPKKAAMAVEILVRFFGADLRGAECGDVAYDVHVRRVFLRSGLIDRDVPEEVSRAAREACPERPGLLDLPAWLIGRETCRPGQPRCEACRIGHACAQRTHLDVEGVGVRRHG